jgi:hypothetical protein
MNREFFENFIEDGKSVKQFCSSVGFCFLFRDFLLNSIFFYKGSRTNGT